METDFSVKFWKQTKNCTNISGKEIFYRTDGNRKDRNVWRLGARAWTWRPDTDRWAWHRQMTDKQNSSECRQRQTQHVRSQHRLMTLKQHNNRQQTLNTSLTWHAGTLPYLTLPYVTCGVGWRPALRPPVWVQCATPKCQEAATIS